MLGLMGGHPGLSPCKQNILNSLNIIETFIHDWFVTRLTRRVPLVKQELISLPEHLSSPLGLVGFMLRYLWFCVYTL